MTYLVLRGGWKAGHIYKWTHKQMDICMIRMGRRRHRHKDTEAHALKLDDENKDTIRHIFD
jgi:hypothetical protein